MEFVPYPKLGRLNRAEMTVTEKIGGTNGLIVIADGAVETIGSRKRAIVPEGEGRTKGWSCDNYGFAAWVREHESALVDFLDDGYHYGEWAGPGIQRNPLLLPERRFFLFNTHQHPQEKFEAVVHPDALTVVPVVYKGDFSMEMVRSLCALVSDSSRVPGCEERNGEGVVVSVFGSKFKMTMDDRPKGVR